MGPEQIAKLLLKTADDLPEEMNGFSFLLRRAAITIENLQKEIQKRDEEFFTREIAEIKEKLNQKVD